MKSFYIFLNLLLFMLAALLLAVNVMFKPYPPDKILSMAPVLNEPVRAGQKIKGGKEEIADIASLWENNLFSPYRSGEGGALLGSGKPTGIELLGVCSFGDVAGAIILDKQAAAAAGSQPSRLRSRMGAASGAAAGSVPRFYKLGDQLENGFTLSEINPDSIVLSRGREQIVLKFEFEGEGAISRNAAAAEAAAASAAVKIEQNPPQNVASETPDAGAPGAPAPRVIPAVPGAPATPGAPRVPGVIGVPDTTAVSGVSATQGTRPRVQPPPSRRQRQPSDPANAQGN